MPEFPDPAAHPRVRVVASFAELVAAPWADGVNAYCWRRTLPGDFGEVVARLGQREGLTDLDSGQLRALKLSPAGRAAAEVLCADLHLLQEQGLEPLLDCFDAYPRDEAAGAVATDVYLFHADRAPVPAATFMCTYFGAPSEGVDNAQVRRHVEIPETRAALRREFGGPEGPEFEAFLTEHCYDLHYAPLPDARPFSFGLGHLWRIAIAHPGCPVPPCVHRAPPTLPGQTRRLLLIS